MTLTEDQIERRIEKMVDNIDRRLMAGLMSPKDYDREMRDLREWERSQYFANKRAA